LLGADRNALEPHKLESSTAAPAYFLRPDDRARDEQGLLVDYELGGVAIQDPSLGLLVRAWKLWVDGEDVRIAPLNDLGNATTLFSGPGITEVTLSFDNNAMPVVAYIQADELKLRWFDLSQSPPQYVVNNFGLGIATPYLTFDDKRPQFIGASDVMLFYVRSRKVWVRLLRERWTVEYEWADVPSHAGRILAAGMSRGNRMQLKFAVPPDFMLDMELGGMGFTRLDLGSALYGGFASSTTDQLFIGDDTGSPSSLRVVRRRTCGGRGSTTYPHRRRSESSWWTRWGRETWRCSQMGSCWPRCVWTVLPAPSYPTPRRPFGGLWSSSARPRCAAYRSQPRSQR